MSLTRLRRRRRPTGQRHLALKLPGLSQHHQQAHTCRPLSKLPPSSCGRACAVAMAAGRWGVAAAGGHRVGRVCQVQSPKQAQIRRGRASKRPALWAQHGAKLRSSPSASARCHDSATDHPGGPARGAGPRAPAPACSRKLRGSPPPAVGTLSDSHSLLESAAELPGRGAGGDAAWRGIVGPGARDRWRRCSRTSDPVISECPAYKKTSALPQLRPPTRGEGGLKQGQRACRGRPPRASVAAVARADRRLEHTGVHRSGSGGRGKAEVGSS